MSEPITKSDLKDLIEAVKAGDHPHNNYYNLPPYDQLQRLQSGPVTGVINSALFWIGALATVLTFVGVLLYAIYSNDSDSKDQRINSNTLAISNIQKTQSDTNNLIIEMQGNQERITAQIERNADTLSDISKQYNDMRLTRFTDKDGDALGNEVNEKIRNVEAEFIRENTELKNELRNLETSIEGLRMMKTVVEDNKSELNRRSNFMEDMRDRVKTLENKQGIN